MTLKLPAFYRATIPWKTDELEAELEIGIKRLTYDESSALRTLVNKQLDDVLRTVALKKKGEAVSEADVIQKSDELRKDTIERYTQMISTVEVVRADGVFVRVKSGADILAELGGNPDFVERLYDEVLRQNRVRPKDKKKSSSPSASESSSSAPDPGRAGRKPERTAESAAPSTSADSEAVTSPARAPSGSMEGAKTESPSSSSTSAPSSH